MDLVTGNKTTGGLIYGTACRFEETSTLVHKALSLGYRNFDLANWPKYYNEKGAGFGLKAWLEADNQPPEQRRQQIWIQTKFTPAKFHNDYEGEKPFDKSKSIPDQIAESATSSIANLNPEPSRPAALTGNGGFINYIDAILLHCPLENPYLTLLACKVLEQHIPHTMHHWGISNVKLPLLKWLAEHPKITIKPKIVQNRFSASNNYDKDVRKYCCENNIIYQAFGVLKNQELLESDAIRSIQSVTSFTPASLLLGLLTLCGVSVLDATTNEQHMKDNLRCFAWMTENVEKAVSLKQLAENLIG